MLKKECLWHFKLQMWGYDFKYIIIIEKLHCFIYYVERR